MQMGRNGGLKYEFESVSSGHAFMVIGENAASLMSE